MQYLNLLTERKKKMKSKKLDPVSKIRIHHQYIYQFLSKCRHNDLCDGHDKTEKVGQYKFLAESKRTELLDEWRDISNLVKSTNLKSLSGKLCEIYQYMPTNYLQNNIPEEDHITKIRKKINTRNSRFSPVSCVFFLDILLLKCIQSDFHDTGTPPPPKKRKTNDYNVNNTNISSNVSDIELQPVNLQVLCCNYHQIFSTFCVYVYRIYAMTCLPKLTL